VHFGTFWPRGVAWLRPRVFFEPGREFAAHAKAFAPGVEVRVLEPGMSTIVGLPAPREPGSSTADESNAGAGQDNQKDTLA
jgi:hypothetical protein